MSGILGYVITAVAAFVFGFFFSRANGKGTDADKVASKVDEIFDEKVKPIVDKLEEKVDELLKKK